MIVSFAGSRALLGVVHLVHMLAQAEHLVAVAPLVRIASYDAILEVFRQRQVSQMIIQFLLPV